MGVFCPTLKDSRYERGNKNWVELRCQYGGKTFTFYYNDVAFNQILLHRNLSALVILEVPEAALLGIKVLEIFDGFYVK